MASGNPNSLSPARFQFAASAILVLALVLRIAAARGNLWQDEITSLSLAGAAHSIAGVFLLAYDNNHYLNTAYLYLVGPDASPLVMRAFSILLGTLTVAAAGLIFLPRDRGVALLAMALFAISFPMVNYGSEARGYSGLILCTMVGIYAVERERKIILALAIGFGLLFHLSMAGAIAALGLAALVHNWQKTKSPAVTVRQTAELFLPSLGVVLPVALIIAEGIHRSNGYHFGYLGPFDAGRFVMGFGGMMNAMLGLAETASPWFGLAAAFAAGSASLAWDKARGNRKIIYFIFLVMLPAAVFLFHVPNSGIRRYYLSSAVAFLLCAAEHIGYGWRKGRAARAIILCLLSAFTVLQIYNICLFLKNGRGHYGEIVALMTGKGAARYTTDGDPWPVRVQLDFYTRRAAATLIYVPEKNACAAPPDWLVIETTLNTPPQPLVRQWGPPDCTYQFGNARIFEGWGMSGARLTLYGNVTKVY